jgi:nucleoside phosphorylase
MRATRGLARSESPNINRDWNVDGARVLLGTVLSGEKLVDNKSLVEQLLREEPEAIGGEMEKAGLCAAAERLKREWILVKAICDCGTGKTDGFQQLAAEHAVSLFEHVLSHEGVLEDIKSALRRSAE